MQLVISCLSAVLCALIVAGCSHFAPRNHVAVPSKEFPYSFDKAPFISPRIIQDLSTWVSDHGDQVVAINVLESQDSNRYFGDELVRNIPERNPYVYHETASVEGGLTNRTEFGYRFVGRTTSGAYVLVTSDWGGGSGVFKNLLLVTFERDQSQAWEWSDGSVREGVSRLLMRKQVEIPLGDRWDGELKVVGNAILIGKDTGWFATSAAKNPDEQTGGQRERVLKIIGR